MFPRSPGSWLQLIGIAHGGVGAYIYRDALREIARRKLVGTVPDFGDNASAFWFMVTGSTCWLSGRLLRSAEEAGDLDAQMSAGLFLIAVGAVGSSALPGVNGFWSLPLVGGAAVRRATRAAAS